EEAANRRGIVQRRAAQNTQRRTERETGQCFLQGDEGVRREVLRAFDQLGERRDRADQQELRWVENDHQQFPDDEQRGDTRDRFGRGHQRVPPEHSRFGSGYLRGPGRLLGGGRAHGFRIDLRNGHRGNSPREMCRVRRSPRTVYRPVQDGTANVAVVQWWDEAIGDGGVPVTTIEISCGSSQHWKGAIAAGGGVPADRFVSRWPACPVRLRRRRVAIRRADCRRTPRPATAPPARLDTRPDAGNVRSPASRPMCCAHRSWRGRVRRAPSRTRPGPRWANRRTEYGRPVPPAAAARWQPAAGRRYRRARWR